MSNEVDAPSSDDRQRIATALPSSPTLADLPELMDLVEAAGLVYMHAATLRRAIKAGELRAIIPRGRAPGRVGRSQGYRITREALTAWFFNTPEDR